MTKANNTEEIMQNSITFALQLKIYDIPSTFWEGLPHSSLYTTKHNYYNTKKNPSHYKTFAKIPLTL